MPWLLRVSRWGESSIQPAEVLQLAPPAVTAAKSWTPLSAESNYSQQSVDVRAEAFVRWQSKMQGQFISSAFKQIKCLQKGAASETT